MDKVFKRRILILFFISAIPAGIALSSPIDPSQATRYKIINNQMDCIEKNMDQNITWNDVCDISDTGTQSPQTAPKVEVLEHWNPSAATNNYPSTDPDLYKVYQFQLSTEFAYFSYNESSSGMKERGPLFGIYGAYDWRPEAAQGWPINVLHLDADFDYALIDYKNPVEQKSDLNDFVCWNPKYGSG